MILDSVTIIGSGNVAFHLSKELKKYYHNISIYGRNYESTLQISNKFSLNILDSVNSIDKSSIIFVCVSDDQTIPLINSLAPELKVIYTSGSTSLNSFIKRENLACLYPLQTFNKDIEVDFKNIPIFIESVNSGFLCLVKSIAEKISNNVFELNSNQRLFLHISAVFANNFSHHLQLISQNILDENNIPRNVLIELRKQTCKKWINSDILSSQTGPASRNDLEIIRKHLSVLTGKQHELYNLLSDSILETYGYEKL